MKKLGGGSADQVAGRNFAGRLQSWTTGLQIFGTGNSVFATGTHLFGEKVSATVNSILERKGQWHEFKQNLGLL